MNRLVTGGRYLAVPAPLAARHVPARVVELLLCRALPDDVTVLLELLDEDEITL